MDFASLAVAMKKASRLGGFFVVQEGLEGIADFYAASQADAGGTAIGDSGIVGSRKFRVQTNAKVERDSDEPLVIEVKVEVDAERDINRAELLFFVG